MVSLHTQERQMINIVCWKWNPIEGLPTTKKNQKYSFKHVNALYEMLVRNVTIPFKLICVTDHSEGIIPEVEIIPLWDEFRDKGGCFVRLTCFKKDFRLFGERFWSIDLDCIITGNINHLLTREEDFLIWAPERSRISKRVTPYCGSLFMLKAGSHPEVYDYFRPGSFSVNRHNQYLGGTDQKQIARTVQNGKTIGQTEGIYNFIPDISIHDKVPENACIMFFNGKFLPDSIGLLREFPWIGEHYPAAGTGVDRYKRHTEEDLLRRERVAANRQLKKEGIKIQKELKPIDPNPLINFIIYWWGNWPNGNSQLGINYINKLAKGIKNNIPIDLRYKIVLFTDDENIQIENVEIRKLDVPVDLKWNLKKMFMYSKQANLEGYSICFDLDTIITGSLEPLIKATIENNKNIITCQAAYKPKCIGGSIVGFKSCDNLERLLWNPILKNRDLIERRTKGSERFYFQMVLGIRKVSFWENVIPGKVLSYKRDCKNGLPVDSAIVRFHGNPRPHEVRDTWVKRYWIGENDD